MIWNNQLYHLPYRILFWLSSLRFLPKLLIESRNKPPLFVACQLGQSHRRPWQTKVKKNGSIQRTKQTTPGDGVSVDHIVSAQPGLIPHMSGFITNQRLLSAPTFLNHVSNYVYVHLMRDLFLTDTLLAKSAMENVMAQARQTIKHYHTNNDQFDEPTWI